MANFAAAKNSNMESGNLIKEGIKQVITEMMDSVMTRAPCQTLSYQKNTTPKSRYMQLWCLTKYSKAPTSKGGS